jgi:virulence-associated protein VagC
VAISEAVRIAEGQRVRMVALEDKMVIEPVRDAIWLALHGRKIGRMLSEEVKEESLRGQERLSKR